MGIYAFFLAGSNFFAPVICGFIAEYHGWQWVFYWPCIFLAGTFVFLYFFLEETNYVRNKQPTSSQPSSIKGPAESPEAGGGDEQEASSDTDPEKTGKIAQDSSAEDPGLEAGTAYHKKTYLQKLSLLGPKQPQNNMLRRLWHTLYYLSWPVIFYAGYVRQHASDGRMLPLLTRSRFSYGSYLIWFNVLNGTSSVILGGAPYNFR